MLDQLLKLAEGPLKEMLSGMNHDQPQKSASVLKESIFSSLKNQIGSGNMDGVKEMFSGSETSPNAPVIQELQGGVADDLMGKLGISNEQAMGIAAAAIPMIMNFFNKRVNDALQDNQDIMSSIVDLVQGKTGKIGAGDLMGSLLGGGKDGGIDLGGLMNMGKGLFK
jgi:hypothetical protein